MNKEYCIVMSEQSLIWLDLEMTGLDPGTDRILEIATIVTDHELNILAEGPVLAVWQPQSVLDKMNEWCVKTHADNGLTERVQKSKIYEKEAEQQTLTFLKKYLPPQKSPMCGNTIGQDRRFLFNYMRELHDFFHYRNIDVSTLKELAIRWKPSVIEGLKKEGSHKALDDVRESIEEMRHYRKHLFMF